MASRILPGTWFAALPDGSVIRGINNPDVLMARAVALQGAVDELRQVIDKGGVEEAVLDRWGV